MVKILKSRAVLSLHLNQSPYARSDNLQFIRFIAAILVIVSHSFTLNGFPGQEFFDRYTDGVLSLGGISVSVFFTCGGYLIAKSCARRSTFGQYFKARVIRIFPPLIFTVFVTVLAGAFLTLFSVGAYFSHPGTYKYLLNCILIPVHELPGVFTGNPSGATVNGALWTLPVEFFCYIALFILCKCHLLDKKKFLFTLPLPILAIAAEPFLPGMVSSAVRPCVLFYLGCAFYVYGDYIRLKAIPALLCLVGLILGIFLKLPDLALYLFLPYLLFYVSFGIPQIPRLLGKTGDIAYGIYLCGYPIQQTLVCRIGVLSPLLHALIASGIAVLFAAVTYLLTEKPFHRKPMPKEVTK